jgi:hypothetical protein
LGVGTDTHLTCAPQPWGLQCCGHTLADCLSQKPLIPDLLKVVVVGKRLPYPAVPHYDKRCAICEAEDFVSVPLEHLPGFVFLVRSNTDNSDQAARTNFFPEFDGNMMPCPV